MVRSIYSQLLDWKASESRKPLMLYGARQVGKTYILKEFGKKEFDNMVYINCFMNPAIKELFSEDKNISRILIGLSALSGEEIRPGKTLVFLDEVQDVPEVVASLKYFQEDAPEVCVAVAGSLLGVQNMEGFSFPTGKVDILHLYPMTFTEFLYALGEDKKAELLREQENYSVVNSLLVDYVGLLRQYYFVGGMPESVLTFIKTRNPEAVRKVQTDILSAYEADIAKHAGSDTQRARLVFQSIPSQLAKENKKFVFGALRKGARSADYEKAIQWLVDAGLVYKVCRVRKVAIPLNFYIEKDAFKLFLLDVGLLGAMAQAPAALMLIGNNIFSEFKGAFTENYVLTQAVTVNNCVVAYYAKENSSMEIDFIVQAGSQLLPVEVKAEENTRAKSLRQFITVDNASTGMHGYRFTMKGFEKQDWVTNVPLFATAKFIEMMALQNDLHEI
ncbi:MAG: AAA family ATPase [Muribaculaceae bacterium]|nr:AAA family ATPase [Muribaculaceae bacterium]